MADLGSYLDMARAGHREGAFHGLFELGQAGVPDLEAAYRAEADSGVRALLVEVIWQLRAPTSVDFLGEALRDPSPEVWRQALDGLATLASSESLQVLLAAQERLGDESSDFAEWLEGAIEDVRGRINE